MRFAGLRMLRCTHLGEACFLGISQALSAHSPVFPAITDIAGPGVRAGSGRAPAGAPEAGMPNPTGRAGGPAMGHA